MLSSPYSYNQISSPQVNRPVTFGEYPSTSYQVEPVNASFPQEYQTNSMTYNQAEATSSYDQINANKLVQDTASNHINQEATMDTINQMNLSNQIDMTNNSFNKNENLPNSVEPIYSFGEYKATNPNNRNISNQIYSNIPYETTNQLNSTNKSVNQNYIDYNQNMLNQSNQNISVERNSLNQNISSQQNNIISPNNSQISDNNKMQTNSFHEEGNLNPINSSNQGNILSPKASINQANPINSVDLENVNVLNSIKSVNSKHSVHSGQSIHSHHTNRSIHSNMIVDRNHISQRIIPPQRLKRIKTPILIDPLTAPVPPTPSVHSMRSNQSIHSQQRNSDASIQNQTKTSNKLTPDEIKLINTEKEEYTRDFDLNKHYELSLIKEPYGFDYKKVHKKSLALLGHFEMPQDCEYKSPLLSPNGKYLSCIAHGPEDFVYVWDMSDLYWYKYKFTSSYADCVAFTPDSKSIIIVYRYSSPIMYDLSTGKKILEFERNGEENNREGYQCSFSTSGDHFAYATDKSLTLWNIKTGEIKKKINDDSPIKLISQEYLICISNDLICEIKRISTEETIMSFRLKGIESPNEVLDARCSKDMSSFLYVIKQGIIRYVFKDNEYKGVQKFQYNVERASISEDCRYLMKTNMKNISVYDIDKQKIICTIFKEQFKDYKIDFNLQKLVVIDDMSITIQDVKDENSEEKYVWLNKNPTNFVDAKFSRDFKILLGRVDRNNAIAYDVKTGLVIKKWYNFDENWIDVIMTTFGGDKIATKSNMLLVNVWNFISGKEEASFYGYDSHSLCFSSNGLFLACGAKVGSEVARIWGIEDQKYASFTHHGSNNNFHTVVHLTSPEPKRLICCSIDQQPLVFNTHTRELLYKCECPYRFEEIYEIQSDLMYDVFIIKGRDDKKRNVGLMYKISDGTLLETYENYTVLELARHSGILISKSDNINDGKLTSTDIKDLNDPTLNDFQIQASRCKLLNDNKCAVIINGDNNNTEYNLINIEDGNYIGKINFMKKYDRNSASYITVDSKNNEIYFRYFEFLSPQETMVYKKKKIFNVEDDTEE